ncbi:hypothetical protein KQX63_10070 [Rhodopseudomonas palustris]|uniref:hypothetical protein n=1 Tax=Rhodopseudomonas palustris TaxID=1076 RepID=UPI0021F397A8|nr:hypothetical protein [Rhodopseudomonas palustris]UYO46327.1 hypothetical protein KQX63_10070 [Rhodopseudomonas palustris]
MRPLFRAFSSLSRKRRFQEREALDCGNSSQSATTRRYRIASFATPEHFDERLDEYLLGDIAGYILPSPMVEDSDLADEAISHVFRLVDPKTKTFVLLGKKYPFGPMHDEITRIAELSRAMR